MSTAMIFLLFSFCSLAVGVERCYYCSEICEEAIVQNCTQEFSSNIDFECYSFQVELGNSTGTWKGCLYRDIPNHPCKGSNLTPGRTCSTCNSELCNRNGTNQTSVNVIIFIATYLISKFL